MSGDNLRALAAYRKMFEVTGGLMLIVFGVYLLNAYFFWIAALAG